MLSKSVADVIAVVNGAGLRHTMAGPELIMVHIVLVRSGNSGEIIATGLDSNGSLVTTAAATGCGLALGGTIPESAAECLYNPLLVVTGFETGNRGLAPRA